MRKVAHRLETGAASLYAYVSSKDELLELVFDELVGQVQLPEPDPETWREQLITVMRDFHGVLVSHRDVALAGLGRIPTTPRALAAEGIDALMRAGGLSDHVVALGLDQLLLYVAAHAFEQSIYEHGDMSGEDLEQYFEEVTCFFSSLPAERFPVLASIADELVSVDGEGRLEFGLESLIAGLESLSARERANLDRRGRPRQALGEVAEARRDDRARLGDQLLGDERLGRQHQRGHRRGVLDRQPRDRAPGRSRQSRTGRRTRR